MSNAARVIPMDHAIVQDMHNRVEAPMSQDPALIIERLETKAASIWHNSPSIQMDEATFVRQFVEYRIAQL